MENPSAMVLITLLICWGVRFPVLAEVVVRVFVGCVSVLLDLPFYPFFYLRRDSYVDPLGVLHVSLLLHDCPASSRTRLDT